MLLQYAVVAVVVILAASYLVRQTWRTWTRKGCGGCGCAATKKAAPPAGGLVTSDELLARVRRPR
jgi:ABC-type uncharacterized transport system YnjBCD permease subunit